jgi:hypothetical protein
MVFSIIPALFRDCFYGCVGNSSYESHYEMAMSQELSKNCVNRAEQSRAIRGALLIWS